MAERRAAGLSQSEEGRRWLTGSSQLEKISDDDDDDGEDDDDDGDDDDNGIHPK